PATPSIRAEKRHTVFRLWLPVLAVSRREAQIRAARRLRSVDLCRSRIEARNGGHGGGKKRQRGHRILRPRTRRALARYHQAIWELVGYRRFGPSRGMHLRVRTMPVVVICAPETSLIWPAGQEPS